MNGEEKKLYEQLVYEREHRGSGWFRTPPAPPAERSPEEIEIVNRVLTEQQEREKGKGHGSSSDDSADECGNSTNGTTGK